MVSFYRNVLEKEENVHEQAVKNSITGTNLDLEFEENQQQGEGGDKARQLAKEIISRGGQVTLTEDGDVADKRELLRAGLNIVDKSGAEKLKTSSQTRPVPPSQSYGSGKAIGSRETGSRTMEADLLKMLEDQFSDSGSEEETEQAYPVKRSRQ